MAFSLSLDNLKMELGIDAGDVGRDAILTYVAGVVQADIEMRIGGLNATTHVWALGGSATDVLKLPDHYRKTFRSVDKVEWTEDGSAYTELTAPNWWFNSTAFEIVRLDGNAFEIYDEVSYPWRVTFSGGWDDSASPTPETLPTTIRSAWHHLTILYYSSLNGLQTTLEPQTRKKDAANLQTRAVYERYLENYFPVMTPAV